ncbi:MAG: acylphosphatase [Campylobacterota bacterium]|nr:acylphosphatase [Campylobacterota bacterium]
MKSYRFIVSGRVQGVFYRKNIDKNSQKENFNGYVKNLSDGTVEACVTCEDKNIENFIKILENGSPNSIVENIDKFNCNEIFNSGFEIKYN